MAELFQHNKSTISRHIKNVFEEGELRQDSVVAKNATTESEGKKYEVAYYNLDMIISISYRIEPHSEPFPRFCRIASQEPYTDVYEGLGSKLDDFLKLSGKGRNPLY